MNAERDALANLIWATSRADEGTISATGANHVADMLLAAGWTRGALGGSSTCPACEHPAHGDTDCGVSIGYDHLNGHHECGCSPDAPEGVIERDAEDDQ